MKADFSIIKKVRDKKGIKNRCGNNVIADGLECPH
jgi:hypothetical protein